MRSRENSLQQASHHLSGVEKLLGERIEQNQIERFVNRYCTDISKRRVANVFEAVFGYALDVDPRSYRGKIVRKSNLNAAHDGKIIIGPISDAEYEREGQQYVYTVHVDNIEGEAVNDLRILWFGHLSPVLYRKQRPVSSRFSNKTTLAFLEPVTSHLSEYEIDRIGEFCRAFAIDYGEMDCLRDRETGRLYIVDVNKTPSARLMGLSDEHKVEAVTNLAVEFAKGFLMDGERA